MRVICGWCGRETVQYSCDYCSRDPELPYVQRAVEPVTVTVEGPGRPELDEKTVRKRYDAAKTAIAHEGGIPTTEAIAERMDVTPRTVRAYRKRYGFR